MVVRACSTIQNGKQSVKGLTEEEAPQGIVKSKPAARVRGLIEYKRPPNVKLGANPTNKDDGLDKKKILSGGRGDLGVREKDVDSCLRRNDRGRGNDKVGTFGPEDVLHNIYAVFHSPEY